MSTPILSCLCGRSAPFQWIGQSAVRIACRCGLELADSAVRVFWPEGDVPPALERYAYKPDGAGWPDAARFVSATAPLALYGHAERWNRLMRKAGEQA